VSQKRTGSDPQIIEHSAVECPRVVIFDGAGGPRIEIVELAEKTRPGDLFCHSGARWQVTATRTRDRVLIARPVEA
jgi:hypothetical protein